ncbi:sugar transferase [Endozoicomonadaceae bacterium StTr2]
MYLFTKRLSDILISAIGLLFLTPLFILISFLIKLDSRGPIFFRQERVTINQRRFMIHKFRTMKVLKDNNKLITIGNDSRITHIGHFLRKYKIDELPQLIDVFIGNMSLVGPRPEVSKYVELYPENEKNIIFSVRAGITDPASIALINESSILGKSEDPERTYCEELLPLKRQHYLNYVNNIGFFYDMKIIVMTLKKILHT